MRDRGEKQDVRFERITGRDPSKRVGKEAQELGGF